MHVMVAGGAGFIGSHIVDQLLERDHKVTVIDNLSTGKLKNMNHIVNFYSLDISNVEDQLKILSIITDSKIEAIIHQAGQVSVQNSIANPGYDVKQNVLGTIMLLENARKTGIKRFVFASSAAVYGEPRYLPLTEQHPCMPMSTYGISKHSTEHHLSMYNNLYNMETIGLRYANVYGPRQDATGEGGVVAIFIQDLLKGKPPKIYGNGEQTRDFIYVKDVAYANVLAIEKDIKLKSVNHLPVFNISTANPLSVNVLYQKLNRIIGANCRVDYVEKRKGDIFASYLDNRSFSRYYGWLPETTIEEGLQETVQYYKQNID